MKAIAGAAAAALLLWSFPGEVLAVPAEASFIVVTEGDPTNAAAQAELFAGAEIGYLYTAALTGFSCTLPAAAQNRLSEIDGVSAWYPSSELAVPQLYDAVNIGGVAQEWQDTGFRGEGQVIAVLDTEIDLSHGMFSPIDDKQVSLTKDKLTDISPALSVSIDPDRAFVNTKVPYAVSYTAQGPYDLADRAAYHGTHVCGIAAGSETEGYSGVAPDAQIVFMGVFEKEEDTGRYVVNEAAAVAALDDAVKLDCDVINLSFGMMGESEPLTQAILGAEKAGVTVTSSAGNVTDNTLRGSDGVTVTYPSTIDTVISVGSADNSATGLTALVFEDGEVLCRNAGGFDELDGMTLPLEAVYPAQLEALGLTGKIAVFLDDGADAANQCLFAKEMGAAAVVSVGQTDERTLALPCALIDPEELEKLTDKMPAQVTVRSRENTAASARLSSFSALGPTDLLTLAPTLTAPGGRVISAGYKGSFHEMSGTSMAAPYAAGCAAILRQSLTERGVPRSRLTAAVRTVLMNTAKPLDDKGAALPRRQGAGLIDLQKACDTGLMLTGNADGAILFQEITSDTIYFTVTQTSIGDNAEAIARAQLELFATDLNGDIVAPVPVSVDLTPLYEAETAVLTAVLDLSKVPEGSFIEGYLCAETTEGNALSMPVLGYFGDWGALPLLEDGPDLLTTYFGSLEVELSLSPAQLYSAEEEPDTVQNSALLSPNGDGFGDGLRVYVTPLRTGRAQGAELIAPDGSVIALPLAGHIYKGVPAELSLDLPQGLPDGSYLLNIDLFAGLPGSAVQTHSISLTVDNTAPRILSAELSERDGRSILTVQVSDPTLDAAYITAGAGASKEPGMIADLFSALTVRSIDAQETDPGLRGFVCRSLAEGETVPFEDIIPAAPGSFTLEYDVTGLSGWTVTFMDRAFNVTELTESSMKAPDQDNSPEKQTAQVQEKTVPKAADTTLTNPNTGA